MPLREFPTAVKTFSVRIYKRPMEEARLRETHIAFTGSPQRHFFDPDKVLLVTDPFSRNTSYFEFLSDDIAYVEELQTSVDIDGNAIPMVRIWVRKGSIAIRSTPFVVADTSWQWTLLKTILPDY